MLLKSGRSIYVRDTGGFSIRPSMPGWLLPKPVDHGHGPLAMVVETIMEPGRAVAMHEHQNDEIVSWVPDGVMRHDGRAGGQLVVDKDHLMIMNAGRSFWHSEKVLATDPQLRMLQILIRPHAADLDPVIQHQAIAPAKPNTWRHIFGPEGGNAPMYVRNQVEFFDIRLDTGARGAFPSAERRDLYFYVFSGEIEAGGKRFALGEQGLLLGGGRLDLAARAPTVLVAFLIDPSAPTTRIGTVGDTKDIPPPGALRVLRIVSSLGLIRLVTVLIRVRRRLSVWRGKS